MKQVPYGSVLGGLLLAAFWAFMAYLLFDELQAHGAERALRASPVVLAAAFMTEVFARHVGTSIDDRGIRQRSFVRRIDAQWSEVERWRETIDGVVFVELRGRRRLELLPIYWGRGRATAFARAHLAPSVITAPPP